ncbi:hypothetical protein, partial [Serratia bockelmannii]|uniref:hypothetical protein n=1 Tax=Serratia bockelmannii TaxID=2703793 RepID=UPI0036D05740
MNRQQRLMTFANPADLPGYQDVSKANLQARKPRDLKLCDSLQERIGRIVQMHANDRKDIDELHAGDIA